MKSELPPGSHNFMALKYMDTLFISFGLIIAGLVIFQNIFFEPKAYDLNYASSLVQPEVKTEIQPHAVLSLYKSMYEKGLLPKHGGNELNYVNKGKLSSMSIVSDSKTGKLGVRIDGNLVFGTYYPDGSGLDAYELGHLIFRYSESQLRSIQEHDNSVGEEVYKKSIPKINEEKITQLKTDIIKPEGGEAINPEVTYDAESAVSSGSKDVENRPSLSGDQKERLQKIMSSYYKKSESSGAKKPSEPGTAIDTSDAADKGATNIAKINVEKIQESKTALYYIGKLLPKAGFNSDGEVMTKDRKKAQVKIMIDRIKTAGETWSVHYPANGEVKKTIAVFGDPTCPYCKKLHEHIPELQASGVEVYYMFYNKNLSPQSVGSRAAVNSDRLMTNVWCSDDSPQALNDAMNGYDIRDQSCSGLKEQGKTNYPGNSHWLLGRIIDMKGTPYTITDDGEIVVGFSNRSTQPKTFLSRIGL
jgi:thiol-disulfide isomerase/thioredoxin